MALFLLFIFGTLIGSFLNVVILRLPKEESLGGRSYCPHCRHILSFWDLFPILSFVFFRGRCRYCQTRISPRYFIIEFFTGLLFAASLWLVWPTNLIGVILLIKYCLFAAVLLAVFVIDWEHFLILDQIVFPSLAAIIVLNFCLDLLAHGLPNILGGNLISGFLAAVALALPFFSIWYFSKGQWMGFGDVKLALLLGAALGLGKTLVGFLLAAILGGLVSSLLLIFSNKTMKSKLPFGTFLSAGSLIALFYGDILLRWYLRLLGF